MKSSEVIEVKEVITPSVVRSYSQQPYAACYSSYILSISA